MKEVTSEGGDERVVDSSSTRNVIRSRDEERGSGAHKREERRELDSKTEDDLLDDDPR